MKETISAVEKQETESVHGRQTNSDGFRDREKEGKRFGTGP